MGKEAVMVVKMLKSRSRGLLEYFIVSIISLAFCIFLQCMISLDTNKYVDTSTAFFMGITSVIFLVMSFTGVAARDFNMQISMGGTRKAFIMSTILMSVIKYGLVLFVGFVMHKIQQALLLGKEFADIDSFFKLDICIIAVLMITAVEFISGSIIMKFGMKAYWIIWGLWMIMSLSISKIGSVMESKEDSILKSCVNRVMEIALNITRMQMAGIAVVFVVVLTAISSYIIMKQDVTA